MCIKQKIFALIHRVITLVTSISQPERVLLNYGIYDSLMCFAGVYPRIPNEIRDVRTIVTFESCCYENLSREVIHCMLDELSEIDTVVESTMVELQIDKRCRQMCTDVMLKIRRKALHIANLNKIAEIAVDRENEAHCQLLYDIWSSLDDRSPPESFDVVRSINKGDKDYSSWGDLGFQTPFKDFRMTGLLGLQSMKHLSTKYSSKSRNVLCTLNKLEAWLPYALTCINVTAWVLEDIRQNKIAAFFYIDQVPSTTIFYELHAFYFFSFVNYWISAGAESVLEFKTVSEKFREHVIATLTTVIDDFYNTVAIKQDKQSEFLQSYILNM